MLDVRRLRLLVELSQRGTLTAVAEALSYSPSSVSQQLSQLEKEVGVPLLVQVGRRVQLTPQAQVLVGHAQAVLERLEEAEADVARSLTTVGGTVRIAVFQSAAHAVVPQALTLLAAEHPSLRVEITEREPELALFDVAARDFDLVVAEQYPGYTRPLHPELDRVPLARDAIRLALPPATDAGGRGGAQHRRETTSSGHTLAAASARPWVLEPEGTASREWAEQLCRQAGFEPDVRFETADLMAHIRLIRSGNAVGLLPDLVWAGEAPSVQLVPLPGEPEREVFSSTRQAAARRPAVVAARDALARAAARSGRPDPVT
ncbi:DNA-binding transcriptional LysR family regulator [Agromyces flavus]|uniref:DNA-binding transcriptional LysR family regulator n=1 Tax=Agromyces flavus TaxID=589382 RepID=A0A1H1YES7_9MICO|nr:LysR substrate-binding domain-containing protein [Agromyces flavus]MCP2366665.1 DNA-binding transcriptional LysR family regulator [Agromyces flavus]GGI45130.1 transcriptional regulator [Agromyces flavus]SDT19855.1 DNA-binding transcriptional regulator, LysR family [Agromyces flavus]